MTCREARQLMDAPDQGALDAHLLTCGRCREVWERRVEAARALAAVRDLEPEPPAGLAQRVKAAVALESAPQQALASLRETEVPVPAGLALRIKQAAADQAHTRRLPWILGTPALVGTVASLLVVAASVYVVGGRALHTPPVAITHNFTPAVAPPAPTVLPAPAVPQPAKVTPAPKPVAPPVVPAAVARAQNSRPAVRHVPASRGRAPVLASTDSRLDSPAGGVAPSTLTGSVVVAPAVEAEAPVAPAPPAAAPATDADRGLVAGLVASFVVERYVAERIIQSEPTLLAVTTSVPTAPNTALSGITPQ